MSKAELPPPVVHVEPPIVNMTEDQVQAIIERLLEEQARREE